MKNYQKGFAVPLVIAIAVLVVGGGIYAYTKYLKPTGPISYKNDAAVNTYPVLENSDLYKTKFVSTDIPIEWNIPNKNVVIKKIQENKFSCGNKEANFVVYTSYNAGSNYIGGWYSTSVIDCGDYYFVYESGDSGPKLFGPFDLDKIVTTGQQNQSPIQSPTTSSLQVTQIKADMGAQISSTDLARAKELFQKNNIDISKVSIVSFSTDQFGKVHIGCRQFYKGLRSFSDSLTYHFDETGKAMDRSAIDGTKNIFISGDPIGNITLSDKPGITMYQAASKVSTKMKSKSFTAELGVLDLNGGASDKQQNFVLVWKIMPKTAQIFPFALVDAQNGDVLRYDDGIRY